MAKQLFSNNASTTLSATISSGATTLTVPTGKGALFSSPSGGDYELLTISDGTNVEIVKMTGRSSDTLTIVRGQEGTSASGWTVGATTITVEGRITKQTLKNIAGTGATEPTSFVLGQDNTSVVTNGVSVGVGNTDAVLNWAASTTFYASDVVVLNESGTDHMLWCSSSPSAVSGSTAPSMAGKLFGDNVTDGYITWKYVGTIDLSGTPDNGISYGRKNKAFGGTNNMAIGAMACATGDSGLAIGTSCIAGEWGVALGKYAFAQAYGYSLGASIVRTYGIGLGYSCEVRPPVDNPAIAIGYNMLNTVGYSHVIAGMSLIPKYVSGYGFGDLRNDFVGQENMCLSDEIDLKQTAADNLVTWTVPTGAAFYLTEVGFIITTISALSVQPQVSFGNSTTVDVLAQTAGTKTAIYGKNKYTPLITDGITGNITASLKVSASGTTVKGRFYIKGHLIESQ